MGSEQHQAQALRLVREVTVADVDEWRCNWCHGLFWVHERNPKACPYCGIAFCSLLDATGKELK